MFYKKRATYLYSKRNRDIIKVDYSNFLKNLKGNYKLFLSPQKLNKSVCCILVMAAAPSQNSIVISAIAAHKHSEEGVL